MITRLRKFIQQPAFLSVGLVFAILSIMMAFWVTRLPLLKVKLSISDGDLGIALFFLPLGSLIAMVMASKIIHKYGDGKITIISTILFGLSVMLPFLTHSYGLFCFYLLILGITVGLLDISMNAVAGILESREKTIIMSTCHGFFSLGGMIGAGIASILIGMGIHPLPQLIITFLLIVVLILLFIIKNIWAIKSEPNGKDVPIFVIPTGGTILLAIIAFCIMIGEGAVMDWSTIYLEDFLKADPYIVGFGYAGFSLFMTIGRFNGDYIVDKLGQKTVMTSGAILALVGITMVVVGQTMLAIIGFSLIGLGYSTIVPIIFSHAAKIDGMAPAHGIAAVAGSGYMGFLIGPVLICLLYTSPSPRD